MDKRFNPQLAKQIGSTLYRIRQQYSDQGYKITQADIASEIGVSPRHYGFLERGERLPSFEVMLKIAKAYNICFSEFAKSFDYILNPNN